MRKLNSLFLTVLAALLISSACFSTSRATVLANQPVFANSDVPGNLALALSVEFPTAISVANLNDYADANQYLGYFDPNKCYSYAFNSTTPSSSYFQPVGWATGPNNHNCNLVGAGLWSGNFMNWATMQTIDPYRWALTGGYRSVDTTSMTILEKAWGSAQGGVSNFPDRGSDASVGSGNHLPNPTQVTPFSSWPGFDFRIWANGNAMVFSGSGYAYGTPAGSAADLTSVSAANTGANAVNGYRVYVRVQVCVAGLLESNCTQYGSHYKPEGLLQQYSQKIRYSAFSYLNEDGYDRQGAVLREPMGFIGPTYPQPLSAAVITNTQDPEWDPGTGIMNTNPDTTTSGASGVSQSGVMNFLNGFGEFSHSYMTYDNVSELYYAIVRYFENMGNVPEWTNGASVAGLDGFPAVTTWTDPIIYSCQKNFILGIGDDHTWFDYNVGGALVGGPRPVPSAVAADSFNKAGTWLSALQALEGLPSAAGNAFLPYDAGATDYIAGLAYGVHVNDIRPDLPDAQTISTYWMDVAEYQRVENLNQYYLATKYGGFKTPTINSVPPGPAYNMSTALTASQWDTSGQNVYMSGYTHPLPDHYFVTGSAQAMVDGLTKAFSSISNASTLLTTSFSFASPNVSTATLSFGTGYNSKGWTSYIQANSFTFDSSGNPISSTPVWNTDTTLQTQVSGLGWKNSRVIATFNGSVGIPFEYASLTSSQQSALIPSYATTLACADSSTVTALCYLEYLRGDQEDEIGSTGPTPVLRARALFLGDIVNASLDPIGAPIQLFSNSTNAGYTAFKSTWSSRPTMVYAGANDGMLHAFVGTTGQEQFAYVPSFLYQGPNGTPSTDGLAALGDPNYNHRFYVDGTPGVYDMDLNRTGTDTPPGSNDWESVLIGGLGKGGRGYYAIKVTDPASITSEAALASNVLWEFTDSTMGYSYGLAQPTKTKKYGWVVMLTSGYNNSDGYGYLYIVNAKTGALLEKIKTPSPSSGMTQASGYAQDYSDDTVETVYVGDLNGQVWRFDLTQTSGTYPQPILFAKLTDGGGVAQPVTTAPLIEIHPVTRRRYVMVGTGRLLDSSDIISTQMQSFYIFFDGTTSAFNTTPVSGSFPIVRSSLKVLADTDLASTTNSAIGGTYNGWIYDLGIDGTTGIGWRMIINPEAYNGIVTFPTLLTSGDACNPSGSSRVYAFDYSTGTSVLQPSPIPFDNYASSVIDIRVVDAPNPEIIIGFASGSPPYAKVPANLTGTLATRILNWREVPTVE